mmetsp:Transcript_2587/g.7476  ORF Transcript_2587/g.7476 Transcript_2587/m.7476 type:complete len:503 (+) Transcript_2587:43-1551(+)
MVATQVVPLFEAHLKSEDDAMGSKISKQVSFLAQETVIAPVGAKCSVGTAVVVGLNMTLGTGPLTLPFAFAQAGLILGSVFLGFCCLLAYITATFIIETLMLENADRFEQAEEEWFVRSEALHDGADGMGLKELMRQRRPDKVYKIRERIEMGEMGRRVFPWIFHRLLYMCIFLHIFGCLCVYSVALVAAVESFLPEETADRGVVVLGLAAVLLPLSLVNVQKLRELQFLIMILRALAILALIGGGCYVAATSEAGGEAVGESSTPEGEVEADGDVWMWGRIPLANPARLPCLYSNTVLAFMVHHALPGYVAPLDRSSDAPKAVAVSYIVAYAILLVLAGTALWAFGVDVPPLYNLAFSQLPQVVNKLLRGYPLSLIAVYPVIAISLRNNLMNFFGVAPPDGDGKATGKDLAASAIASMPPLCVAYFTSNVQGIIKIFAGYFGLSLMLFWPCMLLKYTRESIAAATDDFPLKSRWGTNTVVAAVGAAWATAIMFNTYRFFLA